MSNPRVTGAMRYAQDVEFEGMLHARILRSPYPHAHVLRVDTSAVPDHIVVLTPDDIRELGKYGCQIKDQTVLAVDRARFAGDPVAAVAAPTRREAEEALSLIDVEYEELPGVYDAVAATLASAPLIHEQHPISDNDAAYFGMRPQQGTNICHRFRIRHGNIQEGFDKAEVIVEETYRTAGAQHAHMEPHASVAFWKGDRLEIWTGTQTPFNLRMDLAGIFGIPEPVLHVRPGVQSRSCWIETRSGSHSTVILRPSVSSLVLAPMAPLLQSKLSAGSIRGPMPTVDRVWRRRWAMPPLGHIVFPMPGSIRIAFTRTCPPVEPSVVMVQHRLCGLRNAPWIFWHGDSAWIR